MEKAVARQLEEIESRPSNSSDRTSILKEDAVPSNMVAEYLAGRMPWSPMLSPHQAGGHGVARQFFVPALNLCSFRN